jgi:hypothetical protein
MSGDTSRFTYDEANRYSRVLEQQGRVRLDADFNEAVEIELARERKLARDIVGDAAVPRATTPHAFEITAGVNDLLIGAGRMYVDGLVAEAFAGDPLTYTTQPFYPDPPPLATAGLRALAYLDVWERELTDVQEPLLRDVALRGLDTTFRTQTIWQVKLVNRPGINCNTDLDAIFPPSPARMTVHVAAPPPAVDPCLLPQSGGFRDVDNRHYRVTIHGSSPSQQQVLFARDPIESAVTLIATGNVLTVERLGRDLLLRFAIGDDVEFLTERRVLRNEPGILAKIVDLDPAASTVTLSGAAIPATELGTRAWLTVWHGVRPLPATLPATLVLESGISVEFTGGTPHHADFWTFAARAATHDAGPLVAAPPRGVIHHYAPLALVRHVGHGLLSVLTDCRTLWPPECDCECASCVNPVDHNTGRWTIQMAIDKVGSEGGGKICFKPGTYFVETPLQIVGLTAMQLTGHGDVDLVYTGGAEAALFIEAKLIPVTFGSFSTVITIPSNDVIIEQISFTRGAGAPKQQVAIIEVRNSYYGVVIRRCLFNIPGGLGAGPSNKESIAIALDETVRDVRILDNIMPAGGVGVSSFHDDANKRTRLLFATDIEIRGNFFTASNAGIRLLAHGLTVRIRDNSITAEESAIRLEGTTFPGTLNIVDGNWINTGQGGIAVGCERSNVTNNVVFGRLQPGAALVAVDGKHSLIVLYVAGDSDADTLVQCLVTGNRCLNTRGIGILVAIRVEEVLIKQNFIRNTAGAGILLHPRAARSQLKIENNELHETALGRDPSGRLCGIRLPPHCDADVSANTIENTGLIEVLDKGVRVPTAPQFVRSAAIAVELPRRVRIHENTINGVAAAQEVRGAAGEVVTKGSAAIDIDGPFGVVEVTNNSVNVAGAVVDGNKIAHCYALRVENQVSQASDGFTVIKLSFDISAFARFDETVDFDRDVRLPGNFTNMAVWYGWWWITLAPATELLLVRTNVFQVEGVVDEHAGIVRIVSNVVRCTFGGNFCVSRASGDLRLQNGVEIAGETIVCDSNQIFGRFGTALSVRDVLNRDLWTIVGNIVQGVILVNGNQPLGPWDALNRIAP